MKKKPNKEEGVTKEHIKKISKITDVEDLFMLTSHFKEEDNKNLYNAIKELNKNKKKSQIHENVQKIIKENKSTDNLRTSINNALVEETENRYSDLKDKGSERRKKGIDTLVSELKLMSAHYKLKLFKATGDKKDYLKIKKFLDEVEKDFR